MVPLGPMDTATQMMHCLHPVCNDGNPCVLCDQCNCLDLYLLVNLMVSVDLYYLQRSISDRSVGVVNLFEIDCFIGMVNSYIRFYYSVYFCYNICLEILINLRIYLVFMRILLCIL